MPGERDECLREEQARIYTIKSPLISRTSRYRVLLRLEAIERILEKERPDIIECGDPYQVAWKAVHSGAALRIPVSAFTTRTFLRPMCGRAQKFCGKTVTEFLLDFSRRYIRIALQSLCAHARAFARARRTADELGRAQCRGYRSRRGRSDFSA